jgi:tetratricopeptide (TPR) repeat protein
MIQRLDCRGCHAPGCLEPGGMLCGKCENVAYCGSVCQKRHWKTHRSMCLEKLGKDLLPFDQVLKRINQLTKLWKDCESSQNISYGLKVLKYLLAFAEYQYGKALSGKSFRERPDGSRVDNMFADIELWQISSTLGSRLYNLRTSDSYVEAELYFLKARESLLIWEHLLNSNQNFAERSKLLGMLSTTERYLADLYASQSRFIEAEQKCSECLKFARQTSAENETIEVFKALRTYGYLHERQSNYDKAISFFEDAYICVSEAYGPVHPRVQEAAGYLTDSLLQSQNFCRAEGYARINYESLIDPHNGIDPNSFEVARGAQQLAQICYLAPSNLGTATVSYEEGEYLARKALKIVERIFHCDHINVGSSLNDLANVLHESRNFGDETRDLYMRVLLIYCTCEGPDGRLVMESHSNLGALHQRRGLVPGVSDVYCKSELLLSKSHFEKSLRISMLVNGTDHAFSKECLRKIDEIALCS